MDACNCANYSKILKKAGFEKDNEPEDNMEDSDELEITDGEDSDNFYNIWTRLR